MGKVPSKASHNHFCAPKKNIILNVNQSYFFLQLRKMSFSVLENENLFFSTTL